MFRQMLTAAAALLITATTAQAAGHANFDDIAEAAKGQEVFFNAWGGDERINAYIRWAGDRVEEDYGVKVTHVKLEDTAAAVAAVLADKTAGRTDGGKIDLIWINGENFASMKRNDLLAEPFVDHLPNAALVDFDGKPTTRMDFTVPTDGLEAPWGQAQFHFIYDSARVDAPESLADLAATAASNPGRFTYPAPTDFIGTTFLKQVLIETTPDASVLSKPADEADAMAATAPVWAYLDALHPNLWRGGRQFPANGPAQRQLLDDGELDYMLSFTVSEAASLVAADLLPASVKSAGLKNGTIGNTHFVAIPFNAAANEGAQVLANFLMSAEAQNRKADISHWGDGSVLKAEHLTVMSAPDLGPVITEPDPSWVAVLEKGWLERYGQ